MPAKHRGRPRIKAVGLQNFRLSPAARAALDKLTRRHTWTKTAAVERALLFANTHPDFGRPLKEAA